MRFVLPSFIIKTTAWSKPSGPACTHAGHKIRMTNCAQASSTDCTSRNRQIGCGVQGSWLPRLSGRTPQASIHLQHYQSSLAEQNAEAWDAQYHLARQMTAQASMLLESTSASTASVPEEVVSTAISEMMQRSPRKGQQDTAVQAALPIMDAEQQSSGAAVVDDGSELSRQFATAATETPGPEASTPTSC